MNSEWGWVSNHYTDEVFDVMFTGSGEVVNDGIWQA